MSNVHLLQIEILDIFPCIAFMTFSSYEFIGTETLFRTPLQQLIISFSDTNTCRKKPEI